MPVKVPPRFLTTQHHLANEQRVYDVARAYVTESGGKIPSTRLLERLIGTMDHVSIHRHLNDLEMKGRIKRVTHGRRTIAMDFPEQP